MTFSLFTFYLFSLPVKIFAVERFDCNLYFYFEALDVLIEKAPEPKKPKKKKKKKPKYIDFNKYAEKLPIGMSPEEKKKRKELFLGMDQSNNGSLSLAEIELGIKNYVGEEIYLMKPAIKMAYKIARGSDPTDVGEEQFFVDKSEFRALLVNIRYHVLCFWKQKIVKIDLLSTSNAI